MIKSALHTTVQWFRLIKCLYNNCIAIKQQKRLNIALYSGDYSVIKQNNYNNFTENHSGKSLENQYNILRKKFTNLSHAIFTFPSKKAKFFFSNSYIIIIYILRIYYLLFYKCEENKKKNLNFERKRKNRWWEFFFSILNSNFKNLTTKIKGNIITL